VGSGVSSSASPRMRARPPFVVGGGCSGRASLGSSGRAGATQRSSERSLSCSASRHRSDSGTRSADAARACDDSKCPYTPERVPVSFATPRRTVSRGRNERARGSPGGGARSNSRLSSSPSGWPGWGQTSTEVVVSIVSTACDTVEETVQTCTGEASNAGQDPSPCTPRTPRSLRQNEQARPQQEQQALRNRSPRRRPLVRNENFQFIDKESQKRRQQSLPSHRTKATNTEPVDTEKMAAKAVPSSPLVGPQSSRTSLPSRFSSPVLQSPHGQDSARQPGSSPLAEEPKTLDQQPLLDQAPSSPTCLGSWIRLRISGQLTPVARSASALRVQSSRASLPSSISSSMAQSSRTQEVERPPVERPPGSVATAAAAAAAAVAAVTAAGSSERVTSSAEGLCLLQRPASHDCQRASNAGAWRQDSGRVAMYRGMNGVGKCGNLSARGHASQGDAPARIFKPQVSTPQLRKTLTSNLARASVSTSPRRIASSNKDSCEGRISALKSELDFLRDKTGTIRQQLKHFKATQSSLLSHGTAETT